MFVLLHCLLLTVITSTVFCRPEGGIHQPTDSSVSPLDHTTDSKYSFQPLVTSDSFEESKKLPSTPNSGSGLESDISQSGASHDSTSNPTSESKKASNEFVDPLKFPNAPKESDEAGQSTTIHNHFGSTLAISNTEDSLNPHQEGMDDAELSQIIDTLKDSEESVPLSGNPSNTQKDSDDDSPLPLDSKKASESDDSFRKALIEDLKSRILQKLHLPSPPSNVSPFDLSLDVLRLMHREEDDVQSREEENLIVHPSNSDFTTCSTSSCRKIEFNITSDRESVLSVQAWVNKRSSGRLTLSVYSASEVIATIKENPAKMTSEVGWAMFELPTMSLIDAKEGVLKCIIETEGDINTEGASSPFLVVRKYIHTQKKTKRSNRSTNENCSCCTENHYITIKDLGWQNWVISPAGFNVKTCAGQCEENRSSFTINYQRIISTLYKINKTIPKPKCSFWAPSCKPDTYLPQRIMYLYDNGTVHDHLLPDMLIGSCRCL